MNYIPRLLEVSIRKAAEKMPILTITGPRQSGKTTLARFCFPHKPYVNLEAPDSREFASSDPRGFLAQFPEGVIIDEAQYVPELFSYIQVISDERNQPGQFILSGSQNFLLLERITQSLAGRVMIFNLYPLSVEELMTANLLQGTAEEFIYNGGYPRLYDQQLAPQDWIGNYVQSYLERDVRQIINVRDLQSFQRFLKLCAGQVGQQLNKSSMATQVGVDVKTVSHWLSLLEASFIIFLLPPHFKNFQKRLVKSPKLYFADTAIVCFLLGINQAAQIATHYAKGALFENMVVAELMKGFVNRSQRQQLYYWRNQSGHEVDVIWEANGLLHPVEIKSGHTFQSSFYSGIDYYKKLAGKEAAPGAVVYAGTIYQKRSNFELIPWQQLSHLLP